MLSDQLTLCFLHCLLLFLNFLLLIWFSQPIIHLSLNLSFIQHDEIKEVIENIWDWWMEEGKNRERVGELMKRQGFQKLLEVTGIKPDPRMVQEPRSNPYIFWKEDEVEGGVERDIDEFRKYHQR